MKTIGLIGGLGPDSTLSYYRVMNQQVRERLGGHHSCRLILDSLDLNVFASAKTREDFDELRRQLVVAAQRLESAGADFLVIACNTVHRFAQSVRDATSIPLLHIADPSGERLIADGHRCVALLGTITTMESPFYRKRLAQLFDLEVLVPEKDVRDELHQLIVEDLNRDGDRDKVAARLDEIMADLHQRGATAALLACTELGLACGGNERALIQCALPAYDTAILHARSAVSTALADEAPEAQISR